MAYIYPAEGLSTHEAPQASNIPGLGRQQALEQHQLAARSAAPMRTDVFLAA